MYTQHLLDFRTLLVCESILALTFAVLFIGMQRLFPLIRGARAVAMSFLLVVPDAVAVGLRGHISPVVSVLMADTLMLGSLIAMYEAVVEFTAAKNQRWLLWFVAFLSFAVVYFYTDVRPALGPRIVAIALSMAVVRGATALALLRRAMHSPQRFTLGFFGLFMAAATCQSLWRAGRVWYFDAPADPLQRDTLQSTILVTGIFYLATSGLCFLVLTSRELVTRRKMEADWAPLPGMFNRRALEVNLAMELERFQALREQAPDHAMQGRAADRPPIFSIALLEVDRPNRVEPDNSAANRSAMRDVAETISGKLRSTDHIGRFSASQFLLFFAHTTLTEAQLVAERCAIEVSRLSLGRAPITLSIGLAEVVQGDMTATLLARAGRGLKQALADGGNCWRVAPAERSGPGPSATVSAVA